MTEFKDVAHLYLGAYAQWTHERESEYNTSMYYDAQIDFDNLEAATIEYCVPYLMKLKDISEEHAIAACHWYGKYGDMPHRRTYETWRNGFGQIVVSWGEGLREKWVPAECEVWTPEQVNYLTQKGYDLFNLIQNNRAIDINNQKPQP